MSLVLQDLRSPLRHGAAAIRATLIVLSGDITQRACRRQFRAARAFVDRLGAPATLAIPGTHDIPLFNLAGLDGRKRRRQVGR